MEKQTDGVHVRTESHPVNERQAERFSAVDHRETHRGTSYLYFRSRLDRRRCRLPENGGHFPTSAQNARKIAKTPFSSSSSLHRRLTMSIRRTGPWRLVMFRKYWYILHRYSGHEEAGKGVAVCNPKLQARCRVYKYK